MLKPNSATLTDARKDSSWNVIVRGKPGNAGRTKCGAKLTKVLAECHRQWDNHSQAALHFAQRECADKNMGVDVGEFACLSVWKCVINFSDRNIRRIADNHVKSTALDDAIELDEPVEGLMRSKPFLVGGRFVMRLYIYTIFSGKVAIEFVFKDLQAVAKFLLIFRGNFTSEFRLLLAK